MNGGLKRKAQARTGTQRYQNVRVGGLGLCPRTHQSEPSLTRTGTRRASAHINS